MNDVPALGAIYLKSEQCNIMFRCMSLWYGQDKGGHGCLAMMIVYNIMAITTTIIITCIKQRVVISRIGSRTDPMHTICMVINITYGA